jgi:D-sedoheptulose 7-phosphate isomerase
LSEIVNEYLDLLIARYPALICVKQDVLEAYRLLAQCYKEDKKLLVAGNGGSAADAEHIVGELMKGFKLPRKVTAEFAEKLLAVDDQMGAVLAENLQGALPAIALDGHAALSTAYMNDCEPLLCFAQQVNGYGRPGDVLLAISTSGNSQNVVYAAAVAKAKGMKIIGLTGEKKSKLSEYADVCVRVPETETYMVQELHQPIYHSLCLMLESAFFKENEQSSIKGCKK